MIYFSFIILFFDALKNIQMRFLINRSKAVSVNNYRQEKNRLLHLLVIILDGNLEILLKSLEFQAQP